MADFEVAMIAYVEISLFDLVVKFFLLIFGFFFLFEVSFCCLHFFDVCLGSFFFVLSTGFWIGLILVLRLNS